MAYASDVDPLVLLRDAFYGIGGFKSGAYLVQYPRESNDKYDRRKAVSAYVNYVRPIIESHVKPIFRRGVKREDKGTNPAWTDFVTDATMGGMSLTDFMRSRALRAKRSGCDLIVVTAPKEAPATKADEPSLRPFVYGVAASQITDLKRDAAGRVVSVSFREGHEVEGTVETWTKTIAATGWELVDEKGGLQEAMEWDAPRADAPVVLLAPGDWLDEDSDESYASSFLPLSEFYSIARCAADLFNMRSESREISRSVTFPMLRYPSKDLKGLTIGANNAIGFDPDVKNPPDFIAPPDGPLEQMRKEIDGLVREVYRMAVLSHQAGAADSEQAEEAKSGIAIRLDREDYDTVLAFYAAELESAENRIRDLFAWIQGDGDIEASATYPKDFTQQDIAAELQPVLDSLAAATAAPSVMRSTLYRMMAEIMFRDRKDLDTILEEIDAQVRDDSQSSAFGGGAA